MLREQNFVIVFSGRQTLYVGPSSRPGQNGAATSGSTLADPEYSWGCNSPLLPSTIARVLRHQKICIARDHPLSVRIFTQHAENVT